MNVQKQIDRLITQRAAEWLEVLNRGQTERHPEFVRWIGESQRHLSEFMAVLAMREELPDAFARADIDREALLKRIKSTVNQLPTTPPPPVRTPTVFFHWKKVAIVAGLSLALGIVLWASFEHSGRTFSTAVGEQRTVALADGSVMYLNAHSSVRIEFNDKARDIRLVQGEALFQVARDRQRPFAVRTRDAVVRAIGTQFNVDTRQSSTVVSVLEGKVEVTTDTAPAHLKPEPLSAGEAAKVSRNGKLERHTNADVTNAVAWRQRQLVFFKTPLEDVATDFNRFHTTGRLLLKDIEPGSHHYTGTFDADDVASFARILARETDLIVDEQNGDYVVRRNAPNNSPSQQ